MLFKVTYWLLERLQESPSAIWSNAEGYFKTDQDQATIKPGGRLNKKDGLTRYGNSHVKDKTS